MSDVCLGRVLTDLDVLEPVLSESFSLLVQLQSRRVRIKVGDIARIGTHPEDTITGSETRKADTIDGRLVKDGRRVADALRDVAREIEDSNNGLGDETARG